MNDAPADSLRANPNQPLSEQYAPGEQVPLGGYAALMGVFGGVLTLALAGRRRSSAAAASRLSASDLILLGIATHRLTRVVTRDWVTAPIRAPFTRYQKSLEGGEVEEEARGSGLRKAIGQLMTCRFCTGPWVAAGLVGSWLRRPRTTRAAASVFAIAAVSDFLHHFEDRAKG